MLLIILVAFTLAIGIAAFLIMRAIPEYRTAFLVDTSLTKDGKQFTAIANAVASAVQNSGDHDSLSLRRFGGSCGDRTNTSQVVGAGVGHAQKISSSVRTLTPSGNATLENGILAAVDDFSGRYPFRGSKQNRIIVVTSNGKDACTSDQSALQLAVRKNAAESGVELDFRFVGYKVPHQEQRPLIKLTNFIKAPKPQFVTTPAALNTTLKKLTVTPSKEEGKHVKPSKSSPSITSSPSEQNIAGSYTLSDGTLAGNVPDTNWSWIYEEERKNRKSAEIRQEKCATGSQCGLILHWDTSVVAHGGEYSPYEDLPLKLMPDGSYRWYAQGIAHGVQIKPTLVEDGIVKKFTVSKVGGTEENPITLTWQATRTQ
ncbi:VWA domain-containing protein [Actinomadura chibensis]|uniref:VWA domain-containing protein n=1 Tax=Actinomadura chibensis TaxID=392828 RepID=UPI00082E2162|nr:VWA domain-containing protein [Actinomadura chibensis]